VVILCSDLHVMLGIDVLSSFYRFVVIELHPNKKKIAVIHIARKRLY